MAVLVLAAGRGERLGAGVPKAFVEVAGRSLLARSVARLLEVEAIDRVQPVVPPQALSQAPPAEGRVAAAVAGGAERQDSVAAGLAALPDQFGWVAVHDAARCLVEPEDVRRTLAEAQNCGAAVLAAPATDTIKLVEPDGRIERTLDRARCWAVQTPQVFRAELLRQAHDKARAEGFLGTDDAQLVERLGATVRVVRGGAYNLKITHPADLALAEQRLRDDRAAEQ